MSEYYDRADYRPGDTVTDPVFGVRYKIVKYGCNTVTMRERGTDKPVSRMKRRRFDERFNE